MTYVNKDWEKILSAHGLHDTVHPYVYMGGMDLMTCRNIADRVGQPLREVMYMPLGTVVIFERGRTPVTTQRLRILEDPLWFDEAVCG